MVLGVSTRNYERSLDSAPSGVRSRGTSKSAVSRRFVGATREKLAEMMSRDLGSLALCAVMIDGVHVGAHLVLVALGIDEHGEKHVLAASRSDRCERRRPPRATPRSRRPARGRPTSSSSSSSRLRAYRVCFVATPRLPGLSSTASPRGRVHRQPV
jgi:hypothetical protein